MRKPRFQKLVKNEAGESAVHFRDTPFLLESGVEENRLSYKASCSKVGESAVHFKGTPFLLESGVQENRLS